MNIWAIDPGYTRTAIVQMVDGLPFNPVMYANDEVLTRLRQCNADRVVIEMLASYGMAVGVEVFETAVWIGRFMEAHKGPTDRIFRKDIKLHLCGQARAKDANIRQALIDRFGPGKEAAIGTRATPGPLYGIKADMWAALAVGVTWCDLNKTKTETA